MKKQQRSAPTQPEALFADFFTAEEKISEPEVAKKMAANESLTEAELMNKRKFSSMADLLSKHQVQEKNKYVSQEFQAFGCHLAAVLNDQKHLSLYIKLAKTTSRGLLERALSFVSDADNAKSKARLFMWKLKQLEQAEQAKKQEV